MKDGTIKTIGQDYQIRRKNLRVFQALDDNGITITSLAKFIGVRREGLSKKLQKNLSEAQQDELIRLIYTAANVQTAQEAPQEEQKERVASYDDTNQ